jgi:crotonobetainyl-CoA:carnitine CoA-transferase CaiB-like acyl-CoA transferase
MDTTSAALSSPAATGQLAGVRVCAFTHMAAGPYAGMQLAYLGADVLKIESSTRLDPWRHSDMHKSDPEYSVPFADHNKNVRSVTLNLKSEAGLGLARDLIRRSDVVMDNFSAGVMDRLGLGYEQLCAVDPRVIVLHMAGLGETGPHRDHLTYGPGIMALSGLTHLWSYPGLDEPTGSRTAYPDFLVGAFAAFAIVAALHRREQTGVGQVLDLSQAEVTSCGIGPSLLRALNGASEVQPIGNASLVHAPHGCYPCQDGNDDAWCVISVESDEQWRGLKRAMGSPPWADAPGFDTEAGRLEHVADLEAGLTAWTLRHTPREIMEICQGNGVPASLVASAEDMNFDPHLAARGLLLEQDHPRMGAMRLPGPPIRFSHQPVKVKHLGPLLGEGNEYALREVLGLSQDQYRAYAESGALT